MRGYNVQKTYTSGRNKVNFLSHDYHIKTSKSNRLDNKMRFISLLERFMQSVYCIKYIAGDIKTFWRFKEVRTMKNTLRIAALVTILNASTVFAASNAGLGGGGIGLIGWIFIAFIAVVITFQLIPSLIVFGSMLVSIFGKAGNHEKVTDHGKADNI